jgi:hypothetical protein
MVEPVLAISLFFKNNKPYPKFPSAEGWQAKPDGVVWAALCFPPKGTIIPLINNKPFDVYRFIIYS